MKSAADRASLATLVTLREEVRASCERALARAIADEDEARLSVATAKAEAARLAESSIRSLAKAREAAKNGADFVAVDSLGRAIRDESKRLAAVVAERERDAHASSERRVRAASTLALAAAEAKAAIHRLAAHDIEVRAAILASADDEADERAATRAARSSRNRG